MSQDAFVTSKGNYVEEPVPFIEKPDVTVDSSISQAVLDAKIDSFTAKGTEKRLYNAPKPVIKKPVVSAVKKNKTAILNSGCFDNSTSPLTIEDAMKCSMYHWEVAKEFLNRGEVDSSFKHCQRALKLYENGSLFYLKAQLLYLQDHPSTALQAAEISLDRHDHWENQDRQKSFKVRCRALMELYKMYPSSGLIEKLQKNCQEYF
ncbi:MAG: hypothetical protein JXK07_13375 [Spirochaetes bacterium]|nr:hypothetical protein [Spirochaetota bacterium]